MKFNVQIFLEMKCDSHQQLPALRCLIKEFIIIPLGLCVHASLPGRQILPLIAGDTFKDLAVN